MSCPEVLVIPAAGLGTRMRGLNPTLPKEMLPIRGKPAIQYTVAEGVSVGIRHIILIISRGKEIMRRYVEERQCRRELYPKAAEEMEVLLEKCRISFLYQQVPRGESDAVALARDLARDGDLAVMYPDNLYWPAPGALRHLVPRFEHDGRDLLALMEVTAENASGISNSGRVDIEHARGGLYRIRRFLPKGDGHFVPRFEGELRTCGIGIFGSHFFGYLERARGRVPKGEFTDVPVRSLIMEERGLLGTRVPGVVYDIGNPAGYRLCQQHLQKDLR